MKFYSNNLSLIWFHKGIVLLVVLGGVVGYLLSLKISPLFGPKEKEFFSFRHVGEVGCVAFSPDGKYLVAASRGNAREFKQWVGELLVWELATKKQVASLPLASWGQSLSFSSKGDLLAIGCGVVWAGSPGLFTRKPGGLLIYEFPSLKEKTRIIEDCVFRQVGFSPDGTILVSSAFLAKKDLPKIEIWDTATWKVKYMLKEKLYTPFSISPDSQILVVGGSFTDNFEKTFYKGIVKVYDIASGKEKYILPKEERVVDHLEFSPLRNLLGILTGQRIIFREVKTGKEVTPPEFSKVFSHLNQKLTFSPDGKLLAVIYRRGGGWADTPHGPWWVGIWNMAEKKVHQQWRWPERVAQLTCLAFSPDSKLLAVGTVGGEGLGGDEGKVIIFAISSTPK